MTTPLVTPSEHIVSQNELAFGNAITKVFDARFAVLVQDYEARISTLENALEAAYAKVAETVDIQIAVALKAIGNEIDAKIENALGSLEVTAKFTYRK
jgi:hypothetical protein